MVPMISIESYVRKKQNGLWEMLANPTVHTLCRMAAAAAVGFFLSGASLMQQALPIALAAVWIFDRWMAVPAAAGGICGYLLLWGQAGYEPAVWLGAGLICTLLLDGRQLSRDAPLLAPACAGLIVAAGGVVFQNLMDGGASIGIYLLRVALAAGCTYIFQQAAKTRNPVLLWVTSGFCVLALAQLAPVPWMGLGYLTAAALTMGWAFPAAAISGLALDLSRITAVPMGAVTVLSYLVRLIPGVPRWSLRLAPAGMYLLIMGLSGVWDLKPLPMLLAGGILGTFLPEPGRATHRRGEVGVAQVRLEVAAGVLQETRQLLMEVPDIPLDETALVARAAEEACSRCPCRKSCKDMKKISQLPGDLLQKPLLSAEELPVICRKSGRFLAELHHSQERFRAIRADRQRQREYRAALTQQYGFLSDFLQELSDQLPLRAQSGPPYYEPEVNIYGNRPEEDNGDRCIRFPGTMCKYYILLCDGMGTGLGAVQEGKAAANLLRRMLTAGFPAAYALRSMNSLCALRNRAGAVTADLAELDLNTGKAALYKWGAAPSYLMSGTGTEKIGTAGAPPGLSVADCQEKTERLSLRRGQTLVMVSDGVDEEEVLRCCAENMDREEMAQDLLGRGPEDDATIITVRLNPALP